MAEMVLKLSLREKEALVWLLGKGGVNPLPNVQTLLDLRKVDLVGVMSPDTNGQGGWAFSLTDKGTEIAAKGLPAPRAPRAPKGK